jgi:hypothetical protein
MSGWRRIRAGMLVAAVFGLFWGFMVTITQFATVVLAAGFGALGVYWSTIPIAFAIYCILGALQGLLISTGLVMAGRGDATVDTLPRVRGALLGALVGFVGYAILWSLESGSPPNGSWWQRIPWIDFGVATVIGAGATTAILTIARRGALPPPAVEP